VLKTKNIFYFFSILIISIIVFGCNPKRKAENKIIATENDSISNRIRESKNKTLTINERKNYLLKAYNYTQKVNAESRKNKHLLSIALETLLIKDSIFFRKTNKEAYLLSKKIKDSSGIAETHWNYGSFYSDNNIKDSSYYHYYQANKLFESIGNDYYSGKMLYNMAVIQSTIKDYTGSELFNIKAISKFKPLNKNYNLYKSYNHLGITLKELNEYERSIFYHNEALKYLDKINDNSFYREGSYNNLSVVYQKRGDYDKAKYYLKKALKNTANLKNKRPKLYARLIDNLAYNNFLKGDTTNVLNQYHYALKIRDSINDISGIIINKLHLAEYHLKQKDTLKAIEYSKNVTLLAKEINNNRDHLTSLKLLSKIDYANSNEHLNNYIFLNDSLQNSQRNIREKFTRIRFETDEYLEETKRLSQEKLWTSIAAFIFIATLSLFYILLKQRSKNKELVFQTEQQKYNEQIYGLMLKQQTNLDKGRLEERFRISEELHDGILSKLFGTRMGMGFLNINGDFETIKQYDSYVNELQSIEKEIRAVSHELKSEILTSNNSFLHLIKTLINTHSNPDKFEYDLTSNNFDKCEDFEEKTKINVYRIIQEALMNISKYSEATFVTINFNFSNKLLTLSISDNGIGFIKKKTKKGIGLTNIESRTKKLNGKFTIQSVIKEGTKLLIEIPI